MDKVKITLPDGSKREYDKGITVSEIAYDIGKRLGKDAVGGTVDGNDVDTSYEIIQDVELAIITRDSEKGLDILRHTASHVMAQAIKRLPKGISSFYRVLAHHLAELASLIPRFANLIST